MSGAVLVIRAFTGGFSIGPVAVGSPLNAQTVFALCLTFLLLLRSEAGPSRISGKADWGKHRPILLAAAVALTAVAFHAARQVYFLSDDFCLITYTDSYIADFPIATSDTFFRPVGYLIVALISFWAGMDPVLWHIAGAAMHCAATALLFLLAFRLIGSQWAAFLAAAVFGVHGSRPEAVAWVAGWYDVIAALFLMAGLWFFLEEIEKPRWTVRGAALACMVLALLSKETAFVFPPLLPVLLWLEGRLSRGAAAGLWPYYAVTAAVFAYRWLRLGGIGGYADVATGEPQFFSSSVLSVVKVLGARLWTFLYFPVNWSDGRGFLFAGVLLAGIAGCLLLAASRPDRRKLAAAAAITLICALPALHQLLIGPDMEKSRGLYLPSIGFALLLALAADRLPSARLKLAAVCLILFFHFAALQHNLAIWGRVSALAKRTCDAAAGCLEPDTGRLVVEGLPGAIDGVYFFRNCFNECVALRAGAEVDWRGAYVDGPALHLYWDAAAEEIRVRHP